MASITNSNGRRTIQFAGPDKKRRSIRLGKIDGRTALGVKLHVDHLVQSKFSGMPLHVETAAWLRGINDTLYGRLSQVGLCQPRLVGLRGHMPLGKMLNDYIDRRIDLKPWSIKMLKQARDKLLEFFGENKPIGSITAADAADFKRKRRMTDSEAYVAKQIQLARQFFKDAADSEFLDKSPFAKVRGGSQKNAARQRFIARELIERAIDKAPDIEWKLIIAFARYGGLRIPSEILSLEWPHIRWDEGRITIIASKTEHHVGHEEREIPIFPELKRLLLEARRLAPSNARYLITRYRDPASNLRTQFLRILDAAGVAPWPKLFQNLRSTRQTELTEHFPAHVVCAWLGNTEKIAKGHYLQVTPAHFDRGIDANTSDPSNDGNDDDSVEGGRSGGGAKSGAAHASFAAHDIASHLPRFSVSTDAATTSDETRVVADICTYVDMGAVGFEPTKA